MIAYLFENGIYKQLISHLLIDLISAKGFFCNLASKNYYSKLNDAKKICIHFRITSI